MIDDKLSGYYKVNGKIFYDKIQALIVATEQNADVTWHFFEDVFQKVNWAIEPEISLDELYRLRALQIREQYDYIIVFCSGGADSTQTLYSFLKNNIKVDEVYAAAPISGLNRWEKNNISDDNRNVISETFYTQLPFLNKIKSTYPDVKITVNDYFMDMLDYQEDNWILKSSDWIHPTTVARYSLEKFDHIKNMCESGKRVAAIYGNSKPTVWIKNETWGVSIIDDHLNVARPAFENHPVDLIPFFTSPDLPLILSKQCHAIINHASVDKNKKFLDLLIFKSSVNRDISTYYNDKLYNNGHYERAIVPIIYPSLNYNEFQGLKPRNKILAEHDAWFYSLHKDTRAYKMMMSDISNFLKVIDKRFFAGWVKTNFLSYRNDYVIKNVEKK